MRAKRDAIDHCQRHIDRTRAELQRQEDLGRNTERLRRHLKTLQALRAAHEAARDRSDAA
jgi:hypothetical protein